MESEGTNTRAAEDLGAYREGYDAGWTDGRAAERAILALPPRRWWTRR